MTLGTDDPVVFLRARRAVSDNYATVLLALLILSSLGAWAGYEPHFDPGTRTDERTVATWERSAEFEHGATIEADNPVYETGTRLQNQRAYFHRIAPFLSGTYRFGYVASGGGQVQIEVDLRLRVQSSDGETVFWQTTRTLTETTAADMPPNQPLTAGYEFNMSRARARIDRAGETVGNSPGDPAVLVRAETRMTGEINGRPVDRTFVDTLRLLPDRDAFVVRDPGELTNRTARTEPVERPRTYSPARTVGGPLVALVGIGGAAALVVARRRDLLALSQRECDRIAHEEYEEWLSRGSLPDSIAVEAEGVVELSALVDLVDVAADTGGRVLFDPSRELYAVPAERYTYVCRPPLTEDRRATKPRKTPGAASGTGGEDESEDGAEPESASGNGVDS